MDVNEFHKLIQLRKEGRSLEFKQSTPWSDQFNGKFKTKIVKSILAFSNVRDGGAIIIGVEEKDGDFNLAGMLKDHLDTWNFDDVASYVGEFADPFADFTLERVIEGHKTFLIIMISEFKMVPVICKRDGANILRRGAIYTRTFNKPESAEIRSHTELREILDVAIEKGIKSFLNTTRRVGLDLAKDATDNDLFNKQLEDF